MGLSAASAGAAPRRRHAHAARMKPAPRRLRARPFERVEFIYRRRTLKFECAFNGLWMSRACARAARSAKDVDYLDEHEFGPRAGDTRARSEESHNARRVTVEPRRRQHMSHGRRYAAAWHRRCNIQYTGPNGSKRKEKLAVSTRIAG